MTVKFFPAVVGMAFSVLSACNDDKAEMHRRVKDIGASLRFQWEIFQKDEKFNKITVREFVRIIESESLQHGRADRKDLEVTVDPPSILNCAVNGSDRSTDVFTVSIRVKEARTLVELKFKSYATDRPTQVPQPAEPFVGPNSRLPQPPQSPK